MKCSLSLSLYIYIYINIYCAYIVVTATPRSLVGNPAQKSVAQTSCMKVGVAFIHWFHISTSRSSLLDFPLKQHAGV